MMCRSVSLYHFINVRASTQKAFVIERMSEETIHRNDDDDDDDTSYQVVLAARPISNDPRLKVKKAKKNSCSYLP